MNSDPASPDCRDGTRLSELVVDWVPESELEVIDPRVVRQKVNGLVRLTFTSHLRVVRCGDGRAVREITNVTFRPHGELEEFGVEDPRITPLDGRFYFTYVAGLAARPGDSGWRVQPTSARLPDTASSSVPRTKTWWCSLRKWAAISRHCTARCVELRLRDRRYGPRSPDLIHWGGTRRSRSRVASGNQGGWVPVRRRFVLAEGWLAIYHGNRHPTQPAEVGTYYGGSLLLDATDPTRVLKRTAEPFMVPEDGLRANRVRAERRLPRPGSYRTAKSYSSTTGLPTRSRQSPRLSYKRWWTR